MAELLKNSVYRANSKIICSLICKTEFIYYYEKGELEVLKTFDFNISVSHWIIEWNHLSKEIKNKITSLLNEYTPTLQNIFAQ